MGCIIVDLQRQGSTPTPSIERVGATPTAELDYLSGVPLATLIGLSDVPTATLEHRGGVSVDGSLLCHVGNDTLTLSAESLAFGSADVGVSKNILVVASTEWSVEIIGENSYLFNVTSTGMMGGKGSITVTMVAQNAFPTEAVAMLRVKCRGIIKDVSLTAAAGAEKYTRLTYIESTGSQYINLDYVVQEDDVIEMQYISTSGSSADMMLYGVRDGANAIWLETYSTSVYVRFGHSASASIASGRQRYKSKVQKGSVVLDDKSATMSYTAMPIYPLYLFARNSFNQTVDCFGYFKSMGCKISKTSGEVVMDLKPCKRDYDGKVGMLDLVSGKFFVNQGTGDDFAYGSEVCVTDDYEVLDYVTFKADKLYDAGIIDSTQTIEVLFERTETSKTPFLYGALSTDHTATVSAYLSSGGAWRFGSSYRGFSTNTLKMYKVEVSKGKLVYDFTSNSFTASTFTTPVTLVVGGSRAASGTATKSYNGLLYYFRIKQGDAYVADWMPCKRISDGVEGFWDCVTQTFIEPI